MRGLGRFDRPIRSHGQVSAIDHEIVPVHVGDPLADEKEDGVRHLIRCPEPR